MTTVPLYFDVTLPANALHARDPGRLSGVRVRVRGSVEVGAASAQRTLGVHKAGVLSDGDEVEVSGGAEGGRFILLAARPLREPVVQYGPFVMNTAEEIQRAIRDYQNGELAAVS